MILWFRTEFSLAIAIQNLAWGIATPFFGAFAEKLGDRKAILAGVVIYSLGLSLSSIVTTAASHQMLEILVESVSRVLVLCRTGVVGRASSDEYRSGIRLTTAAGMPVRLLGFLDSIFVEFYDLAKCVLFIWFDLLALLSLPF